MISLLPYASQTLQKLNKSVLLLLLLALPGMLMAETMPANQVKAALLNNFIKHTQWPNEASIREFNVVFLGTQDSFYREFSQIAPELLIRGKKVRVTQLALFDPAALKGKQVLVVAEGMNNRLPEIAAQLIRSGTLLVTDNATDQKLVMINLIYPNEQAVRFEINKSNIVYEGLKISNDVLLHGGSEIEVATLYKEMEFLLGKIKSDVEKSRSELQQKTAELNNKNTEIDSLKKQAATITDLLRIQDAQINDQQTALLALNNELADITGKLVSSQALLEQREQAVARLAIEIEKNKNTLVEQQAHIAAQQVQIAEQQKEVDEKTRTVDTQHATIASQRNIIIIAMALLLVFLLVIINRQKKALTKERQLLETRSQLIRAQEESIEAYQSSDRLKNDFLTAISHEMRTPMNGIMGAVQIADTTSVDSMRSSLDMVSQSSAEMLNLVDSVLSYIEIQSGQMKVLNDPVSLPQVFADLRQHYSGLCQQKSLPLNWHVSGNLPEYARLDKGKLGKILQKLLDNAIKFTDKGAVTLIVHFTPGDNGKGELTCTVKDTGAGIPPELQQHIFDPFWQMESGFTRSYSGLGIGLTICQKLANLMGGDITMSSSDKQGSQFTVTLPIETMAAGDMPGNTIADSSAMHPVLVVEDNPINQQVLELMLNKLGYSVMIAGDGLVALELLEHHTPSVILMDLQMPRMDGFSCTRAIRGRDDSLRDIPIIAITANLMESQQLQCRQAGMNGYLGKPVDLEQLRQTLQQFLPPLPASAAVS